MNIEQFLKQELKSPFYYIPNPGNAGDSVIACASYNTFDKLNLTYEVIQSDDTRIENSIVVLGGGGAISGETSYFSKILAECAQKAKKVVLLPHTVKNIDAIITKYGDKITFCCRELMSFEYISQFKNSHVVLLEDMAFTLNITQYAKPISLRTKVNLLTTYIVQRLNGKKASSIKFRYIAKAFNEHRVTRHVRKTAAETKTLNAFRLDEEKTNIEIPAVNYDISALFQLDVNHPLIASCATHLMASSIARFDNVRTNRLHVAIVAALLGKNVEFYDNSYFKCRAVYEHSIKGKYPKVKFQTPE
ncbi:polysaccharide pyruvyl transferase family protein [Catenovulum sediminis]|uniref:Polysaccharide pyruvyl transferase family protein n=1 Tax=Catenovulum sediminis TaxID=1740262 RepID=A0ABV1RGC9_9ALTE